jgi:hypothetical protein
MMVISGWLVDQLLLKEEWKFASVMFGELSVIGLSILRKLVLPAPNLGFRELVNAIKIL